jgi:hypothetical protein
MKPALGTVVATIATLGAALSVTPSAEAHEVGLSRGDYVVEGARLRVEVAFARKELISLVAGLDGDHDGLLTDRELAAGRDSIEGALVGRIKVTGDGAPCAGKLDRASLTEQDGVLVRAAYTCGARPKLLKVDLAFLDDLAFGHRHLAHTVAEEAVKDQVLSQRLTTFAIDLPPSARRPEDDAGLRAPEADGFRRGVRHALVTWQGALFLLAVLVTCSVRRTMLVAAGAYGVALAFGFALGAGGAFLPSPRAIAIATALSLVYAGLEAWRAGDAGARFWATVPFGVVYGLGYATASGGDPGTTARFAAGAALGVLASGSALLVLATAAQRAQGSPTSQRWKARGASALGLAVAAAGVLDLMLGRS